jgi:hypothetical protein
MLKPLMTIALAMIGLVLPGQAVFAQATAPERTETQERTQDRIRTREETQTRDASGEAAKYRYQYQNQERVRSGQDAAVTLSDDEFRDQDRDRLQDKDLDRLHDGYRMRDQERIHDPAGAGPQSGGRRRWTTRPEEEPLAFPSGHISFSRKPRE